jgi:altronate dehydratase
MTPAPLDLAIVSRLPAPGDNVAIATRRLDPGTVLALPSGPRALTHTVLEGHRFAVAPIATGAALLSWGLPFGTALAPIAAGDYVSNASMLAALAVRRIDGGITLPAAPNFVDVLDAFVLNEATFVPAPPVELLAAPRTFQGYRRPGRRGVGTRNFVVILGTTSRTASYARQLAARLQPLARVHPGIDGIVAIAHTEGGGPDQPNNTAEVLRCLAGFITHPNVAAVLAVDYGVEPITNALLRDFMEKRGDPLADVPHHFLTLSGGLAAGLAEGERLVRTWLPAAHALTRTAEPISALRIALQCGGSDAFSGVSGNPLAGALVHEIIRHGGAGNLCETDEVVGAESYILRSTRDVATARALLAKIESFKQRLAAHGVTPEANPSAGNKFRGLYNIVLKSLGAAHKKDPRTRIDHVIDYAEPMTQPGFHFMNSPGNDLEGIAGQVAAGCNLFLFVTGNGSITNFPFVPTLKVTTTTRRHQLLITRWTSTPAATSTANPSNRSSRKTSNSSSPPPAAAAPKANTPATPKSPSGAIGAKPTPRASPPSAPAPSPDGVPLTVASAVSAAPAPLTPNLRHRPRPRHRPRRPRPPHQPLRRADRPPRRRSLNEKQLGRAHGITRFVALTHTEGCGFGGETMHQLLHRTYRGYVTHPNVAAALFLEHGCEKVPNDVMRRQLENAGVPLTRFGWASVQLDGGIQNSLAKIETWFAEKFAALPPAPTVPANLGALTLGLMTAAPVTAATATTLATLAHTILAAGGSVLLPESDALLAHATFRTALLGTTVPHATLAYGQPCTHPGLHLIASETEHWVENLTGLGGCGAHLVLTIVSEHARQGHPLLPVIQIAEPAQRQHLATEDLDLFLTDDSAADFPSLTRLLVSVAERTHTPAANAAGSVDFQLTRGELGVST